MGVRTRDEFAIEWTDGVAGDKAWTFFGEDREAAQRWLKGYEWTKFGDKGRIVKRTMSEGDWEDA